MIPEKTAESILLSISRAEKCGSIGIKESQAIALCRGKESLYREAMSRLEEQKIIKDSEVIGKKSLIEAEKICALKTKELIERSFGRETIKIPGIGFGNVKPTERQKEAILAAMNNNLSIITGTAGSGKTTIISSISNAMSIFNYTVALVSPTGMGAARLRKATGRDAKTIHAFFGIKPDEPYDNIIRKKINIDLLIIDEVSMLDTFLFSEILQRLGPKTSLCLTGDPYQLPSIAPGNILADLINSGKVKTIKLEDNFRQKSGSPITELAQRILAGYGAMDGFTNEEGLAFIEKEPKECLEEILKFIKGSSSNIDDVLTLSPIYSGICGVDELNNNIRENNKNELYSVGDRVMSIKNDYNNMIWNGSTGTVIKAPNERGNFEVQFFEDGTNRMVSFNINDDKNIILSYARTYHRSQGSQYPIVVLPMLPSFCNHINRNGIFTAITRAEKSVIIVGKKRLIGAIAKNEVKRFTMLKERILAA